jgi:hypothetical protein
VVDNSEEVQKLIGELGRVEKVLMKERIELKELDEKLEAKLRSHPHAKIHKNHQIDGTNMQKWAEPIVVLVFVCNRPEAVKEHLNKLIRFFFLFISSILLHFNKDIEVEKRNNFQ